MRDTRLRIERLREHYHRAFFQSVALAISHRLSNDKTRHQQGRKSRLFSSCLESVEASLSHSCHRLACLLQEAL